VRSVRRVGAASRSTVSDDELAAAVAALVGPGARVQREVSVYSTSATLEHVRVHRRYGPPLRLLLKDLSEGALLEPAARSGKPDFLRLPGREVAVYRSVLADAGVGTPACHAAHDEAGRSWLLLEHVPGIELYQVGDLETWCRAAAHLAVVHARLRAAAERDDLRLVRHDDDLLARWRERAARFLHGRADAAAVLALLVAHERAARQLCELPRVLLHGDLYASNILVDPASPRVSLVDWELAGAGPAVLDLAALTSGGWSEEQRRRMALAYLDASGSPGSAAELLDAVDAARLHLCVQWLGWAERWQPPREHAHDWWAEAQALVARRPGRGGT
jgi:aminoglycoside phosphotransferase